MMEQVEKGLDKCKYLVIRSDAVGVIENDLSKGWVKITFDASNCIFANEVTVKLTGE